MPIKANDACDKTRALQRTLYRAAKRSGTRRFHALYDKVYRKDILERAWSEVKKNHGAPGPDGLTIEAVEAHGVGPWLSEIAQDLREGQYHAQPVRRVMIPKPQGGERPWGVPSLRDRVVQAAVKLVIEPLFEADFLEVSFGFRPRRSAMQARERVRDGIRRERRRWVVDADIQSFFDTVDHKILLRLVRRRISDRRILKLIWGWLRAGALDGEVLRHPVAGTPQGGVLSPLLANIYLHELDRLWQAQYRAIGALTRYADDLVIMTWEKSQAECVLRALEAILQRLHLTLGQAKTRLVNLEADEGFDFLGFHVRLVPSRWNRCRMVAMSWPSRSAMVAARQRIRDLTLLSRIGLPEVLVVQAVNRFLLGWGAYFRWGNSTTQFRVLDEYVTDRLCRFIARKHGRRKMGHGLYELLKSRTRLGLVRLTGTVRYPSAYAVR